MSQCLALKADQQAAFFDALDAFDAAGARPVLVGGMVPPMLVASLGEDVELLMPSPRLTRDCDVVIHVALGEGAAGLTHADAIVILGSRGFSPRPRINQFCYEHPSGLKLDLLPVPAGIESGDARAMEFAHGIDIDHPTTFYRGCEMALGDFVEIELDVTPPRRLRLANFVPLLVMKLQAWLDRGASVGRDAHDVAFVVRYSPLEHLASELNRYLDGGRWSSTVSEAIARLRDQFADQWARGVCAYAQERGFFDDDVREQEQEAVAAAVRGLLETFSNR